MTTGFVFINEEGQFAREGVSCDHGPTRKIIHWGNLNDATVWASTGAAVRYIPSLKGRLSLPATVVRTVTLGDF